MVLVGEVESASGGLFLDDNSNPRTQCMRSVPNEAEIELLGRRRPEVFSHWLLEWGFVIGVVGSMMISEYAIAGFNIILPSVAKALNISDSSRTWPSEVASLSTAVFLLPFARLSEIYGGRVVFLCGHAWLTVWSIACGFCHTPTVLIVCRAMQGLGSSAFLPASLALMGRTYRPGPRKNLVFSMFGAFSVIGFYFGIIFGAISAQIFGWRWYFWIGATFDLIIFVTGIVTIPKNLQDQDTSVKMDCHAPDGWRTPYIYITFGIGGFLLITAVYLQGWIAAQPLLPFDLFRPKYMKRLTVALFLSYGTFGIFLFYASFYIQTVLSATPLQTATWFIPLAAGGIILAVLGGFVFHLIPGRLLLVISASGYLLSVLLFALIPKNEKSTTRLYWAYIFSAMIGSTIGIDIAYNVTNIYITTVLPSRLQAASGALINSLLYLGMAFWLGIASMVASVVMQYSDNEDFGLQKQYNIGFWTGVGISIIALCLLSTIKLQSAAADLTADEKVKVIGGDGK